MSSPNYFILPQLTLLLFFVFEMEAMPIVLNPIQSLSRGFELPYFTGRHYSAPPTFSNFNLKREGLKETKTKNSPKNRRIILASNAPPFHLEEVKRDYPVKRKGQESQLNNKKIKNEWDNVELEGDNNKVNEGVNNEEEPMTNNEPIRKWIIKQVLIDEETFQFYYQDISNCILWPALHNIGDNIVAHENEAELNKAIEGM
uniref:Uncharacterized protein n=1 Tax=Meloidogyne hapla TaxID=6305 RepID=A0A1I8BAK2_MELHA